MCKKCHAAMDKARAARELYEFRLLKHAGVISPDLVGRSDEELSEFHLSLIDIPEEEAPRSDSRISVA
jgi:hypothetical protein